MRRVRRKPPTLVREIREETKVLPEDYLGRLRVLQNPNPILPNFVGRLGNVPSTETVQSTDSKIVEINSDFKVTDKPLLSASEIRLLTEVKYLGPDGTAILTMSNFTVMLEVTGLLYKIGFPTTLAFLRTIKDAKELVWHSPMLERTRVIVDYDGDVIQHQETGVSGVGVCGRCGNTNLVFSLDQTRSGDEAATLFVRCTAPMCGHKWRQ